MGLRILEYRPRVTSSFACGVTANDLPNCRRAVTNVEYPITARITPTIRNTVQGRSLRPGTKRYSRRTIRGTTIAGIGIRIGLECIRTPLVGQVQSVREIFRTSLYLLNNIERTVTVAASPQW